MIEVRGVSKSFGGVHAVRDASFDLAPGEVTGLLGANGAGKTTTIRMVTGFVPPDEGSIRIDGRDVLAGSRQGRAVIGYLPESAPAYPEMRVADFLVFRARLYRMARAARRAAVEGVIDRCRLTEVRSRRIGHLSKGYRQRVGLAAALVHDPKIVILDEPTNALDPAQIRETRELIRELGRTRVVLVSSHILAEVERTCDRVIVMARGRIRAQGRPRELAGARGGESFLLEVRVPTGGSSDGAAAAMRAVPGVARVAAGPLAEGVCELKVQGGAGAGDLREALSAAAARSGLLVRELRRDAPSLERVFLDLVADEGEVRE